MPLITTIGAIIGPAIGKAIVKRLRGGRGGSRVGFLGDQAGAGPFGTPGADIEIVPGTRFDIDPVTGDVVCKKTRRRRKRLLTCSDKADIAFLTGTLGKGALAQTAITSVLARCGN